MYISEMIAALPDVAVVYTTKKQITQEKLFTLTQKATKAIPIVALFS